MARQPRKGASGRHAGRNDAARECGPEFLTAPLDRRRFLIVAGGAAAWLALQPYEGWAKKAARDLPPLQPWTLPVDPPADPIDLTRALIGASVLAPSHWNSQPWRFEVDGQPAQPQVRLVADVRRALPATDPDRRWMMTSLGAALENLLVAARAYGLHPSVRYFPHGTRGDAVAEVSWTTGRTRRDRAMFGAIPSRRTNRRNYDGRGLFPQNRVKLNAQASGGIHLHWIDERSRVDDLAEHVRDAVRDQVHDPVTQAERHAWMRFGDGDVRERGDGVSVESLELGGPAKWFSGRYFNPQSMFLRFGAESAGKQARAQVRSAGALALLTTDRPGEAEWVKAGQTYERIALRCTQVGVSHQPINAPLLDNAHRAAVVRAFDATGQEPLMLLRMGHAKRPAASVRRAVALVSSFRNS